MKWLKRLGKGLAVGTLTVGVGGAAVGCLTRPVSQQAPTTKVNFTSDVSQQAVDKIDLLLAIDNSKSMGDKQAILAEAVPNLVKGLVQPRCISEATGLPLVEGGDIRRADPNSSQDNNFACPAGSKPEFKPVVDIHIGLVSSSLGDFGAGNVCSAADNGRENDRGRLLNKRRNAAGDELNPTELARPSNFLSWFPTKAEANKTKTPPANPIETIDGQGGLSELFAEMVRGIWQNGCGLEAQLESWYHFLVQPDPWEKVGLDQRGLAQYQGVDATLLQQRADFLRADSLVAIILLTDEDDSSADPLALAGQGWAFGSTYFPGSDAYRAQGYYTSGSEQDAAKGTTAPRGTAICQQQPGSKECTSCGFKKQACTEAPNGELCKRLEADAACNTAAYKGTWAKTGADGKTVNVDLGEVTKGYYKGADDDLNVRFHDMKRRFGADPQYPIKRYVDGLTKPRVPDRFAEHDAQGNYVGAARCTNPLFASALPKPKDNAEALAMAQDGRLCNLPRGSRSKDMVFFALVGGVPNDLIYPVYGDKDADGNATPAEKKGKFVVNPDDFAKYAPDFDLNWTRILGRDPGNYNLEGIDPRMLQSTAKRVDPSTKAALKGDWDTNKQDLQFACTFALKEARDCTPTGDVPPEGCDCGGTAIGAKSPLCDGNTQLRAKAYPTVRELQVVKALGVQGIAASLCPITLDPADNDHYGYNPAVAAIVNRLKNALTVQCLPQALTRDEKSEVPCLVIATLGEEGDQGRCAAVGLEDLQQTDKDIYDKFREQQKLESGDVGDAGINLAKFPVCKVAQRAVEAGQSCEKDPEIVWCYVENAGDSTPAGRCPQALLFSEKSQSATLKGTRFSLQCIQQFGSGTTGGGAAASGDGG